MTPLRLRLQNFRSFKKEQEFVFPQRPGLYFMCGENADEPRLEANGAGKSTVWDALYWVLFGKTTRGLKSSDVCNWDADKGVVVELEFADAAGEVHTLRRTWGPISWTLDGADISKEVKPLASHLGLEAVPFLHCILMAQAQPMFMDLKADAKASLFSEVLALDAWLDYSQRASKSAAEQDRSTRVLEAKVANLRGRLESLSTEDLSSSEAAWRAAQAQREAALANTYERALDCLSDLKDDLKQAEGSAGELQLKCKAVETPLAEAALKLDAAIDGEAGLEKKLAVQQERVRVAAAHLRDSEHLEDECPTCAQPVSARARCTLEAKLSEELQAQDKLLRSVKAECLEAQNATDKLTAQQKELNRKARMVLTEYEDARRKVTNLKRDIELQERALDRIEEEADALRAEVSPYKALEEAARKEAESLQTALKEAQADLDSSSARHALLSMWVRGFKDVRLELISEALTQLEIEVNSALTELGLLDWEIRFDVDRETRGGSVQRGFSVVVQSPSNTRPVLWESWSGGEGQRLRIAGTLGLSDLIRSQSGTALALEIFDEPTAFLSAQGVQDLLDCLAARAQREKRTIWVVDHRSLSYGAFDGVVTVVKDTEGSRFVWEDAE